MRIQCTLGEDPRHAHEELRTRAYSRCIGNLASRAAWLSFDDLQIFVKYRFGIWRGRTRARITWAYFNLGRRNGGTLCCVGNYRQVIDQRDLLYSALDVRKGRDC